MKQRGIGALLLLSISIALLVGITLHARSVRAARAHQQDVLRHIVKVLPASDLAWNSGARWVRFVSLEESTASASDGPLLPDPDPAGGIVSPPGDVQR